MEKKLQQTHQGLAEIKSISHKMSVFSNVPLICRLVKWTDGEMTGTKFLTCYLF